MIGEQYGHSLATYTSPTPLGPFSLKKTMTPVYGDPGDTTYFDDDGKAYLVSAAAPLLSSAEVSRLLRRYTTATPAL